jgi:DNA-binding NarL/FixJ family response regulator
MPSGPVPAPIRVLVVEDDAKTRAWLAAVIGGSEGFACVGAHETAERAEREIVAGRPDVILLDLELPRMSGLEWLRSVNSRWPELPVVVLTMHQEPARIFSALEAGAVGYLVKPTPAVRLLEALTDARSGGAPMTGAIARLVLRKFRQQSTARRQLEGLSERETEVLERISEGLLPEEVADALGIRPRTVATHLLHIYRKLHVVTCAQAVARYFGSHSPARAP